MMANVISEEQRRLNKALHEANPDYGNRSHGAGLASRLPTALERMHQLGVCNSVLDYGTGKGKLVQRLLQELPATIHVQGYDPAVEQYQNKPDQPADILTCLDVLEHVDVDSIDAVLQDIKALTRRFCYLVIDLQPAVKILANGRNAHITLAPPEWWITRVSQLFPCVASFPIKHTTGITQKVVIAAAHEAIALPYVYGFLNKLRIYDMAITGGSLGGQKSKAK